MIKEFIYGSEVIPYIQSQLSLGKSLSRYVLENKDMAKATACAYLPASSTSEQRERFQSWVFDGIAKSRTKVTNYLIKQMMNLQHSVALFDNWTSTPEGVKYLSKRGRDFLRYSDEIYLFVKKDNRKQLYQKGITPTANYPTIGVITQSPAMRKFYPGMEISEELFDELCKEIKHLLIGSYDDLTYIILSW